MHAIAVAQPFGAFVQDALDAGGVHHHLHPAVRAVVRTNPIPLGPLGAALAPLAAL
nr:hypothetical protein [Gammaproteobacteria bacterium]